MLKGIPTRIGSDLLKALADMGHGDLIIIADDFYPPVTKTPGGISIQAKGNTAAEMIDAILQLMPLDVDYYEHPVEYMVPDKDAGITIERPKVWMMRSQRWRKMVTASNRSERSSGQNFMKRQEKHM